MSNEQKEHDRLSLDEVRRLTATIARVEDPSRERLCAGARSSDQQNGTADAGDTTNQVDELASDLDDLQTMADEIQEQPPAGVKPGTVQRLKHALSEATAAADDIEDEIE